MSALAFGSFGVPIKSDAAKSVDIDPLVFQSYKTFMCFATSWFILLFEPFQFTPWGIVSGLFWVPGGVATVYAVKSAGLAIGIGIGSSFIVLVSFVWGIFVFGEAVRSKFGACMAVFCMMAGLMGMSYYSSPAAQQQQITIEEENEALTDPRNQEGFVEAEVEITKTKSDSSVRKRDIQYKGLETSEVDEEQAHHHNHGLDNLDPSFRPTDRTEPTSCAESLSDDGVDGSLEAEDNEVASSPVDTNLSDTIRILGIPVSKRHRGMMAAAFCGIWGGSVMAPMKWCKSDTQGTGYLLSFSIGASLITLSLWVLRYFYNVTQYKSLALAYQRLPSFHLDVMWLPGGTSGLLWSIGNFFSILSVEFLGEGVGYSMVQSSILGKKTRHNVLG